MVSVINFRFKVNRCTEALTGQQYKRYMKNGLVEFRMDIEVEKEWKESHKKNGKDKSSYVFFSEGDSYAINFKSTVSSFLLPVDTCFHSCTTA